jgi:hypothetical protein
MGSAGEKQYVIDHLLIRYVLMVLISNQQHQDVFDAAVYAIPTRYHIIILMKVSCRLAVTSLDKSSVNSKTMKT